MHDSEQGFDDCGMALVLQTHLIILAMHQQMIKQILEQLYAEHRVIQIRGLPQSLFEISQE